MNLRIKIERQRKESKEKKRTEEKVSFRIKCVYINFRKVALGEREETKRTNRKWFHMKHGTIFKCVHFI